ncbi:MAG: XRE family transcriptional regulator [Ignavibacteriae bacterium]|nr:MAG: XRE family transcriptional regulator [Ignavibacteriota bacterium]
MSKSIYSKEYKYLFQKLKQARIEIGLDQTDVARKLKTTQSYISKIEHGQVKIDIFLLKDFSKIYKKPLEYFLPKK